MSRDASKLVDQEPKSHESYGMLQLSRVTCQPPQALYGSSIRHGNMISLTISEGEKRRDYQKDYYASRKTLIQVDMSVTQFAEAITCMNVGEGVPVTIRRVIGDEKQREDCPEVNFKKLANEELKEEMAHLADNLAKLAKDSREILGSKGPIKASDKKKLLTDLMFLEQEVRSNITFAHECFTEAVDKTVNQAKGEVDACYQTLRERLGDKMIAAGVMEVPLLDEGDDENDLADHGDDRKV